jgi:heme/copper-type cytochrome/quinol oxidase subunit 3
MTAAVHETVTQQEEPQHATRSLGWYGMVFFIASEAVFFANLFAAYLYLRVRAGGALPHMGAEIDKTLGAVNLGILITSSVWMHFAARAIAKGNKRGLTLWLMPTILFGAVFLGIQAYEYLNNNFGPSTGVIGSTFYTITGFHGAHVTVGLLLLTVIWVRSLRGDFTKDNHFAVTAGEMYWHFVDVVWVFVVTLIYFLQEVGAALAAALTRRAAPHMPHTTGEAATHGRCHVYPSPGGRPGCCGRVDPEDEAPDV